MSTTNPTDAQMNLARECAEIVIITREDRDATAEYLGYPKEHFEPDGNMELDLIRAFAKHRQATEARAQGLVEALTAVHDDLLMRAEIEGDEKIVAVGTGVWVKVCNALATWRRT